MSDPPACIGIIRITPMVLLKRETETANSTIRMNTSYTVLTSTTLRAIDELAALAAISRPNQTTSIMVIGHRPGTNDQEIYTTIILLSPPPPIRCHTNSCIGPTRSSSRLVCRWRPRGISPAHLQNSGTNIHSRYSQYGVADYSVFQDPPLFALQNLGK